jgi:very-short-patch-repair endonuclease
MSAKWIPPNLHNLIHAYESGISVNQLAETEGVSRTAIRTALVTAGVTLRTASEQERLKWQNIRQDRAAVERQLQAAWQAKRGRRRSRVTKEAFASSRQQRLPAHHISPLEWQIIGALFVGGVPCAPQVACGPYNVDIALQACPIAIEVSTSSLKCNGTSPVVERTEYVLNRGWALLYITYCASGLDLDLITQQVLSLIQLACCDKTLVYGRYGMMRGDGQAKPVRCRYLDHFPRIPGF